ncbi:MULTISPECIES: hypothetical protein [Thermomonospora]|uniref:Uncharacterized protein n=1 Tax=Thermomonospora cellulosilytica TaxID=1411118 RepID=A0A7W3MXZ5_9ACTN|nr:MULTISPECIES: hypothetical protein [Thermomonospora]MBA9003919.1 hypothetical protein [Thermomonospora cellulosilytica]
MSTPNDEDRSRIDRGPGAHSGHESQVRERVVPGTAGAAEGYQPPEDDILAGVRMRPGETAEPSQQREFARDEDAGLPPGDQGDEPFEEGTQSTGGRA